MISSACRFGALFFVFLFVSAVAFAQQKKGEIINVNYKYKTAFTDLTEADVKAGDRVQVRLSDGRMVNLEVMESYPVMAKLVVPASEPGSISDEEFSKISVGAPALIKDKAKAAVADEPSVPAISAGSKTPVMPEDVKPVNVFPVQVAGTKVLPSDDAGSALTFPSNTQGAQPAAVSADERVARLTQNTVRLSEHIAHLLTEKIGLDQSIKAKDTALTAANKKIEELSAANQALDAQNKSLQAEVSRLRLQSGDLKKEKADLEQKLVELKKKLARMVDIVNKNVKAYE